MHYHTNNCLSQDIEQGVMGSRTLSQCLASKEVFLSQRENIKQIWNMI